MFTSCSQALPGNTLHSRLRLDSSHKKCNAPSRQSLEFSAFQGRALERVVQRLEREGSVQLSASRTNPYAGEQIEFTLTIKTAPSVAPLTLNIPWLTPQEAWLLQFEQWKCQFTEPRTKGLPLRYYATTFIAPLVNPGEYVLRWKMIIGPPGEDENRVRTLAAVQVGSLRSNALTLEIQRPPTRPPSSTVWDLGIGSYRVSARWADQDVVLGEETTLILAVAGNGPLNMTPAPPLRSLPGWESDRFLLEAMPSQWKDQQRLFLYRVRPRQLRAALPPILVRYFDPQLETIVTRQIGIPSLKVLASHESTKHLPGSTVADALRHLPAFRRESLQQDQSVSWTSWARWLLVIPLAWAAMIIVRQSLFYVAPQWMEYWRWHLAARRARQSLAHQSATPGQLRGVLAEYYSIGLDRPIVANWETLHSLAILTPHCQLVVSLLEQLQVCEFGPTTRERFEQVRRQSLQLFQPNQDES